MDLNVRVALVTAVFPDGRYAHSDDVVWDRFIDAVPKASRPAVMREVIVQWLRENRQLAEKRETRREVSREGNRERKRRQAEDAAYARKHRIAPTEVSTHRQRSSVAAIYREIEQIAVDRAIEILDKWVLPGGRVLGDATKVELLASSAAHAAAADMASVYGRFYQRLASLAPADGHLRDCADRSAIVRAYEEFFGTVSAKAKAA